MKKGGGWLGPLIVALSMPMLFVPELLDPLLRILFPRAGEWLFPRASLFLLTIQHVIISLSAAAVAALIGISFGIFVTRPVGRSFLPLVRDTLSLAQTIPPVAVLALAIPFLGFGFKPVFLALVLYSILPVLNNTVTGLETLPAPILEAARGMGMGRVQVLMRVELPLALPVIGMGVRSSIVINVGTATIGALAGAGGLGSPIVAGLIRDNPAWVFQGAIASAFLALTLNGLLQRIEQRLRPEPLR